MADKTKIEWTDATWNIVTGCSVVSPGCTNCYAMRLAGNRLKHHESRKGLTQQTKAGPVWTGEVRFNEQWLTHPLNWKRPRRIFVCAHGDLFAEGVKDEWLDRIFAIMALCPQHTFQVLTKRPERMRAYLAGGGDGTRKHGRAIARACIDYAIEDKAIMRLMLTTLHTTWPVVPEGDPEDPDDLLPRHWPLPNVWLGVSVEDQKRADERIPVLLATPAALRWISAEPLLGPLDLMSILGGTQWMGGQRGCDGTHRHDGRAGQVIHGTLHQSDPRQPHHHHDERCRTGLGWIVAGGESGPDARPMHPDWVRAIRDQCAAAGVPFNFKQWGNWAPPDVMTIDDLPQLRMLRDTGRAPHRVHVFDDNLNMGKIGKAAAGRLLDGVLHDAFPEVRP